MTLKSHLQGAVIRKFIFTGLEIYDGHAAITVDTPCLCRNAPRNLHDLRPQMACPFFKECRCAFNSYFEKQALKIFLFIVGMNWKVINVYRGDNQIKKRKQNLSDVTVWFQTVSARALTFGEIRTS